MWPFKRKKPRALRSPCEEKSRGRAEVAIFVGMVEDGDIAFVRSNASRELANHAEPMFGQTVLMTAVLRGDIEMVGVLLEMGAQPQR